MLCACALAAAAILLWVAGGYAVASEAVYPLEKSASWFRRNVSCRIRTLWRRQSYAAENARLKREVDLLRMMLGEMERNAPGQQKDLPAELREWVCAPILSRNGATGAKNFLRAGKGSIHGVSKGAAVASPDGLVGIVSEVSPHTCTIKMKAGDAELYIAASHAAEKERWPEFVYRFENATLTYTEDDGGELVATLADGSVKSYGILPKHTKSKVWARGPSDSFFPAMLAQT